MSEHWERERKPEPPRLAWEQIEQRLCELWPDWKPNRAILGEWRAALGGLNLEWVDQAISAAYRSRPTKEPRLARVMAEFGRITTAWSERRASEGAAGPTKAEREQAELEQLANQHDARVTALRAAGPEAIAAALAYVRHVAGSMVRDAGDRDPGQWSQMLVGLVWAALSDPRAASWIAEELEKASQQPARNIPDGPRLTQEPLAV